jgi:cysteine desulfurase / selenocysteine lyase
VIAYSTSTRYNLGRRAAFAQDGILPVCVIELAVGLGAALDYVNRIGLPNIAAYEHELLQYATEGLSHINGLRLIGTAKEKVSVLSFVLANRSTEDVGRYLNQEGIAVRSGHHCSQSSLRRFGVESTVRPSLTFYNTRGEIDRLVEAIKRIQVLP